MSENTTEIVTADEATDFEKEQESVAAEQDLLAGLPAMVEPHKLRMRQRNALKRVTMTLAPFFAALRRTRDAEGNTHMEQLTPEDYEAMFEATDAIDAFGESLAVNKDAYAAWSAGKGEAVMLALYTRYQRASGE